MVHYVREKGGGREEGGRERESRGRKEEGRRGRKQGKERGRVRGKKGTDLCLVDGSDHSHSSLHNSRTTRSASQHIGI